MEDRSDEKILTFEDVFHIPHITTTYYEEGFITKY